MVMVTNDHLSWNNSIRSDFVCRFRFDNNCRLNRRQSYSYLFYQISFASKCYIIRNKRQIATHNFYHFEIKRLHDHYLRSWHLPFPTDDFQSLKYVILLRLFSFFIQIKYNLNLSRRRYVKGGNTHKCQYKY